MLRFAAEIGVAVVVGAAVAAVIALTWETIIRFHN